MVESERKLHTRIGEYTKMIKRLLFMLSQKQSKQKRDYTVPPLLQGLALS